jgi:ABC-type Mn2+/Zn2+ transport system permease subunit
VFAAVQGAAAVAGGVMAGALYERSLPILIAAVIATQIVALALLLATLRRQQKMRAEALTGAD